MSLLHVRDIVRLRSGGPPMTITETGVPVAGGQADDTGVRCRWFYAGQSGDEVFPERCLIMADAGVHRHLIGIESPPDGFVLDHMTIGPSFPSDWEVETWIRAGSAVGYWLRAWNKSTARYAIAKANTYSEAADNLRDDVSRGGSHEARVE
jgi:uncharacterized protein YodC (DUF2158 family)